MLFKVLRRTKQGYMLFFFRTALNLFYQSSCLPAATHGKFGFRFNLNGGFCLRMEVIWARFFLNKFVTEFWFRGLARYPEKK